MGIKYLKASADAEFLCAKYFIIIGIIALVSTISFGILVVLEIESVPYFIAMFMLVFSAIILFVSGLVVVGSLITSIFTVANSYEIKDNEIVLKYKFITQRHYSIRLDKITSIELKKGFFQRKVGIGSIKFGIFGDHGIVGQNNQLALQSNIILAIKNPEELFEELSTKLNMPRELNCKKEDKANHKITNLYILFSILLIFTIVGIVFFPIILIASIYSRTYLKNARYLLYENYVESYSKNFFNTTIIRIPYKRITNVEDSKNFITYGLFKVGHVLVYTGSAQDVKLSSFNNFHSFYENLSLEIKKSHNMKQDYGEVANLKSHNLEERANTTLISKDKSYLDNAELILTPNNSFIMGSAIFCILGFLVSIVMFFVMLYTLGEVLISLIIAIIIFVLPLFFFVYMKVLQKSTKYYFFDDKIVETSGVFTSKTIEIRFDKLKSIALSKSFPFEYIMNQGTIHLSTAGTIGVENRIDSIKDYEHIYLALKEILKNDSDKEVY